MDDLLPTLHENGFWHSLQEFSWEGFREVANTLGTVINVSDVDLHRTHRRLHQPEPLELHTDYVEARYVGWWCLWPDSRQGATQLLDAYEVLGALSDDVTTTLTDTYLTSHGRYPLPPRRSAVVFDAAPHGRGVHFAPFDFTEVRDDATRMHALTQFRAVASTRFAARGYSVRLQARQALFIDNWRMLHGRGALDPHSPRHLKRIWIATNST